MVLLLVLFVKFKSISIVVLKLEGSPFLSFVITSSFFEIVKFALKTFSFSSFLNFSRPFSISRPIFLSPE